MDSQTQLSDANRAGYTGSAVSAITIKTANLSWNSDASIEKKPVINTLSDSTTSTVSKKNTMVKVDFIKQKRITTTGWSTNDIYQIGRLDSTSGLKILYVDAVADTNKTIIEAMGAINTGVTTATTGFAHNSPTEDSGTVSTSTPYLIGRVSNLSIRDAPNGDYWRISFDFTVSN